MRERGIIWEGNSEGKMKNTKVQKCKRGENVKMEWCENVEYRRCENVKSERCENVKRINGAFENPKKLIVIILITN